MWRRRGKVVVVYRYIDLEEEDRDYIGSWEDPSQKVTVITLKTPTKTPFYVSVVDTMCKKFRFTGKTVTGDTNGER